MALSSATSWPVGSGPSTSRSPRTQRASTGAAGRPSGGGEAPGTGEWEEHGGMEWPRLFSYAIGYADDGFIVGDELAGWIRSEYVAFPENAKSIYGSGGEPLAAGDRLVQEDLADSLRKVAEEGAEPVY